MHILQIFVNVFAHIIHCLLMYIISHFCAYIFYLSVYQARKLARYKFTFCDQEEPGGWGQV